MKRINGELIGKISGITHFLLLSFMTPYLINKNETYAKSLDNFDPLSELGNSSETKLAFQLTFIFGGILLFLYTNLYFRVNRVEYKRFKTYRFSLTSLNVAAVGQIGVGVFPREAFPYHLLATLIYAAGLGAGITTMSLDLENTLTIKKIGIKLAYLGYFVCTICFINIFYFRYTPYRGIAQIGSVAVIMIWYAIEEILHRSISYELILSAKRGKPEQLNKVAYVILFTSAVLIAFGATMQLNPSQEPWKCNSRDQERCSPTTAWSIITSGMLLILFVILYYSKIISMNIQKFVDKSIRIKFG